MWNYLPNAMHEPLVWAFPVFVVLFVLEAFAILVLDRGEYTGYNTKDSWTNIGLFVGAVGVNVVIRAVGLVLYTAIYAYLAPWHLSTANPWLWIALFFAVDFHFFLYHWACHRVRIVWAGHQVHHSSEYFNFTTAARQKWSQWQELPLWIPLALLGVPPWATFAMYSANLAYQYCIHTEAVDRLPRPIEWVFNTPSHHRVHHGRDPLYLDKNFAGILIIWDRLFGTFQVELDRPHYGLTKQINTYNLAKIQFHEFAAIARDLRRSRSWREAAGYVFGPPGWEPVHTAVQSAVGV